jgi:hypothetical protein
MQDLHGLQPDRDPLNTFRHIVAAVLMAVCVTMAMTGGARETAVYVGGTIDGAREKARGRLLATSEKELRFEAGERSIAIPFAAITSVEYGQKVGRKVAVPIVSGPIARLPGTRNHLITIAFKDPAAREQAGVFELGNDIVRPMLQILEVRTGRQIEMQDEAACLQLKSAAECSRTRDPAR